MAEKLIIEDIKIQYYAKYEGSDGENIRFGVGAREFDAEHLPEKLYEPLKKFIRDVAEPSIEPNVAGGE